MGVPSHANPLNIFHLQALVCPLTLTRSKPLVPLATTTAPSTSECLDKVHAHPHTGVACKRLGNTIKHAIASHFPT